MKLARLPRPLSDASASRYREQGDCVLSGRILKPNSDRSTLSRFGEDRWDLSPAVFRENVHRGDLVIDFGPIGDPAQRLTVKEYLWARLNPRKAGLHRAPLAPAAAKDLLRRTLRFTRFVEAQCGTFSMTRVDQPLLDAYLAHLRSAGDRPPAYIAKLIEAPIDLHRCTKKLTLGGFACRPWNMRNSSRIAGCKNRGSENLTPRIPEPVIGALLHWAFKYIDLFAPDILGARAEYDGLSKRPAQDPASVRATLEAYVGRRCLEGRGIPVHTRPGRDRRIDPKTGDREAAINFPLIALHLGCTAMHMLDPKSGIRPLILEAYRRMGPEIGGMDTPISVDPDTGTPWRERFDQSALRHEEKMLQTACFVVCAYLSGMRDSELQAMETGCHVIERSDDGIVERHKIISRIYKGNGGRPQRAQWVTIAPVGRAIAMIENLTRRQRTKRNSSGLWQVLSMHPHSRTHLSTYTSEMINNFREHLDCTYGNESAPAIPRVDERPWRFTVRQFRRTLAWYIANRPFGTVAGKIQYKHASIAMFEGYGGSSASGFRLEVEQERALGQLDDVVEHYESYLRGLRPTGPASGRLLAEFAHIRQELGDFPGHIVDHRRLRTMLAHLARTLHVGFLNDCFFEPATALCLDRSGRGGDHAKPVLSHCSPGKCPNSCIARRHLPPWEASIAEAATLLKRKHLSRPQREALVSDQRRMRSLIAPLLENPV